MTPKFFGCEPTRGISTIAGFKNWAAQHICLHNRALLIHTRCYSYFLKNIFFEKDIDREGTYSNESFPLATYSINT